MGLYLITAIFIFCILLWIKITEYSKGIIIGNQLIDRKQLYIFGPITIILIVPIEFLDFIRYTEWPSYSQWIYIALVFLVLFYWLSIINDYTAKRNPQLLRSISVPATIILNILFAILMALLVGIVIPLINEYSMAIIFLTLILLLYILVKQFKIIIGTGTSNAIGIRGFAFATVFSYIFFNVFILYTFGQYNLHLSIIPDEQNYSETNLSHLLLAGGSFFFDFPNLKADKINELSNITLFATILQYYVGLLVNLLILPFYISYFSSLLFKKTNRNNKALHNEVKEFINIGDGI